jgi:pimeloyl-ACP methyl ester carboxylesterase
VAARGVDGAILAARVDGDGDPLLLIAGLGATRRVFDPVLAALAQRYRVITYDPRGVGDSEHGTLAIGIEQLAADATAVMEAAGCESAHVLGASMGGVVAQRVAVEGEHRVRRLILAATHPPRPHAVPASPSAMAALLGRGAHTPEEAYRIACTVLYSPKFQRSHAEFIDEQVRVRAARPVPARVFRDQLAALRQPSDVWERLAGVGAPTLVLHGTADVIAPFENARLLAHRIPGARLRPFEECGHLFFHERPDETARVVHEFLRAESRPG